MRLIGRGGRGESFEVSSVGADQIRLRHRALRARLGPGAKQLAELRVSARSRSTARPRRPRPNDQAVGYHMVEDRLDVATAIASRILELLADLSQ